MRRFSALLLCAFLVAVSLAGCQSKAPGVQKPDQLMAGMLTDTGSIDDRSFNQGAWEGIKRAEADFDIKTQYVNPENSTAEDYIASIERLVGLGYTLIICPGFTFEQAVYQMQDKYPDVKFVIIDGTPNNGENDAIEIGGNTVSLMFAGHEAGFLAGIAAALEAQDGKLGFIGSTQTPAVKKLNWGFQRGVYYANENYGTNCVIQNRDIVYQGALDDITGARQYSAAMYDRDVKIIFTAAGSASPGVINEAADRRADGDDVWVIGDGGDRYSQGLSPDGSSSAVLTSAIKAVDTAVYDIIKDSLDDAFPGGQQMVYSVKNDGVMLPDNNPNLSSAITAKLDEVVRFIKNGALVIPEDGVGVYEP